MELFSFLQFLTHRFDKLAFFDSQHYQNDTYSRFQKRLAIGSKQHFEVPNNGKFLVQDFDAFRSQAIHGIYGIFSYDLKNSFEHLTSKNPNNGNWPIVAFFEPEFVVDWENHSLKLLHGNAEQWQQCLSDFTTYSVVQNDDAIVNPTKFSTSFEEYCQHFNAIKNHIYRGDIYEMNYCIQAEAVDATINPIKVFQQLQSLSAAPFSAFFKYNHQYLLSSSPERYLAKRNRKIISQPIKGTAKRHADAELDAQAAANLASNAKEQQENVMIVDLVRNDLSRTATKGSVTVEELFGIYTFPAVHQMISTVVSELKKDIQFETLLATTFPMGSMTGAPKISAMQIADQHESFARAWYSGALGYIEPNGDFDFSVVIRSILYNQSLKYLQIAVGSAITIHANAEAEFKECLLKAEKMISALTYNH